jgi:hypothetical protein
LSDSNQPPPGKGVTGARVVAVFIGLLFLMAGIYLLNEGFESGNMFIIMLGLLVFSLFLSFTSAGVRVPVQNPIFRTVTVAKCSKCEYAEVRDFQRGDYFYKVLGKCKECSGDMYVKTIYAIPLQKTQLSTT